MRKITLVIMAIAIILGGVTMSKAQQPPPILQPEQQAVPPPAQTPPAQAPPARMPAPPPAQTPPPPEQTTVVPSNFLGNAAQAVETAKEAKKYFSPGKIWTQQAPRGEVIIKAAIIYQGVAVGALEFNPLDGTVLPRGYHPRVFNSHVSLETIRQKLPTVVSGLTVLNGAEYREPEACWVIPIAYNSKIVAHIKISYDGTHIIPDYPTSQEMQAFGR